MSVVGERWQICRNKQGRLFWRGQADPPLAQAVKEEKARNPMATIRQISTMTGASIGLVHKTIHKQAVARHVIQKQHSLGAPALAFAISNPGFSRLYELQRAYKSASGEYFHISSFSRLLSRKMTKQRAKRVDPRKFSQANTDYYLRYAHWMETLQPCEALKLAFFDEARVDLTGALSDVHFIEPVVSISFHFSIFQTLVVSTFGHQKAADLMFLPTKSRM